MESLESFKSLDCLTSDCIALLKRTKLLRPLIRAEVTYYLLNRIKLEDELKENIIENLKNRYGFQKKSKDYLESWLKEHKITLKQFEEYAISKAKMTKLCMDNFGHQVDARFLERKNDLDRIVYSILRLKDPYKAHELYQRIIEKEADFSTLAAKYSEGPESQTRGLVGPVTPSQGHPHLMEMLRTSKPGEVLSPFRLEDTNLIVRLESYNEAKLDEMMKEKMADELYSQWLESEVRSNFEKNLLKRAGLSTTEKDQDPFHLPTKGPMS